MVMVDIDDDVYNSVKKLVEEQRVDYPTIKNFIDKAVREKVRIDAIRAAEEKKE